MQNLQAPPVDGGANPTPSLQEKYNLARARFIKDPSKCYQRHIREVWEDRPPIEKSIRNARVEQISRAQAKEIILKFEWLAANPLNKSPMGYGTSAYYGLILDGELIGANCLGRVGGQIGNICGETTALNTACLMRGACVPHAPKNAASYFIRQTCRQAKKDFGWCVFFAYSDTQNAGEIGTVYQAAGWIYLGEAIGSGSHWNYLSPDGKRLIKSHALNHDKKQRKIMRSLGWNPEMTDGNGKPIPMRRYLVQNGWTAVQDKGKHKYVWFEGNPTERAALLDLCLSRHKMHAPLPYPKRGTQ